RRHARVPGEEVRQEEHLVPGRPRHPGPHPGVARDRQRRHHELGGRASREDPQLPARPPEPADQGQRDVQDHGRAPREPAVPRRRSRDHRGHRLLPLHRHGGRGRHRPQAVSQHPEVDRSGEEGARLHPDAGDSRGGLIPESRSPEAEDMLTRVSQNKCFGGVQSVFRHEAKETGCPMRFGLFLLPQAQAGRVPVLYWLSGLSCTEENFIIKAGAQRVAAELGLAIVVPDTSPRGVRNPGDDASYDFGLGAGFYVDATEMPWASNYRMYSYVTEELPRLVAEKFPVDAERVGIFGHSMGGDGALTVALKNPQKYRSLSAFAPIASPMRCP